MRQKQNPGHYAGWSQLGALSQAITVILNKIQVKSQPILEVKSVSSLTPEYNYSILHFRVKIIISNDPFPQ